METLLTKCSDCGNDIVENQTHCSMCNSTNMTILLHFEDTITIKDKISGKSKDYSKPSKNRVVLDFISGSEQSKNGKWVEKERVIDKTQNNYFEQIIDEHGNVIHFCSEKLTDHIGHGSAKFSKKD